MRVVDVVIPTLRKPHAITCLERLTHIPWPMKLHLITGGKTWAEAVNIGLKRTSGDVILMDDDVFINEDTFAGLDDLYEEADIFGFKLMFPDGVVQHMGGIVRGNVVGHVGYEAPDTFSEPLRVCHATTSLVYIKRKVLDKLGGMAEDIPGIQMEDVDFSFRALKAGFQIIVLPQAAVHIQSATKKYLPDFGNKVAQAQAEIVKRHLLDEKFKSYVEEFPQKFLAVV